jgi:hypothetical protein
MTATVSKANPATMAFEIELRIFHLRVPTRALTQAPKQSYAVRDDLLTRLNTCRHLFFGGVSNKSG